jgi:hypothetical protein
MISFHQMIAMPLVRKTTGVVIADMNVLSMTGMMRLAVVVISEGRVRKRVVP